jgi:exonuclease SbcC
MELRELRIGRLPGIDRGFTVRGEAGLNLIVGPNGSGKTSLTNAVLGLLWPGGASTADVGATWKSGDSVWTATRTASTVAWQRDGQPAQAPTPPGVHAGAYRLGILSLLKQDHDADDAALARSIRNQLAGGYDLPGLAGRWSQTPEGARKAGGEVREARQNLQASQAERAKLADQENRLPDLRRQLVRAKAAQRDVEVLEAVRGLRDARIAADDAEAALNNSYPAAMARLTENDPRRLDALRRSLADHNADADSAARDAGEAARRREAAALPDGGPDDETFETAINHRETADALAVKLADAEVALAAAEAGAARAAAQLAPWDIPADDDPVDPAALRTAAANMAKNLEGAARRKALQQLLDHELWQTAAIDDDPAKVRAGRDALLTALSAGHDRSRPRPWPAVAAAVVLLGVGLWLQPWSGHPAGWPALAGALAVLGWALVPRSGGDKAGRARNDFEATGLPGPSNWSVGAVRKRLAELDETMATLDMQARRHELRAALKTLHQSEAAPSVEGQDATPDATELIFRTAAYHEARRRAAEARTAFDRLASDLDGHVTAAADLVAPWVGERPTDIAALKAALSTLGARRTAHREATAAMGVAERSRDTSLKRAEVASRQIEEFMRGFDLTAGDDHRLRNMADRLDEYRRAATQAREAAAAVVVAQGAVDRLDADATSFLRLPDTELDERLESARQLADDREDLHTEIIGIESALEQAGRDTGLDQAHARLDKAVAELTDLRDRARAGALGSLLIERVRASHRRTSEPPVLARARQLLVTFTNGRYDLQVDDESDGFRAIDTRTGGGLTLRQLSDGTRAQLLLAARLAHLAAAESGAPLPLFMDESLTASDPERFRQVGNAVLDMMDDDNDKRQVFYLTCDPADVRAWQELLAERGGQPAPVTDLAALRRDLAAASADRLRPAPRPAPPSPRPDQGAADYAVALSVPALDAHRPATDAHLFYLLRDDLQRLHGLLTDGLDTVGQALALRDSIQGSALLERRASWLTSFLEAFAEGRGRRLPAGIIGATSGMSSKKIPEIDELAAELDGDPRLLMQRIAAGAIKRLQSDVREDLEDWLRREGYLSDDPVLTLDQVKERVLRRARGDIAAGTTTAADLASLVGAWWAAAGGDAGDDPAV